MIIYAGYGEIGIQGLQSIFSDFKFSTSDIVVLNDPNSDDFLFKNYCKKYKLKTINENQINQNTGLDFDICISVHWRKKIKKNLINLCKKGGINLHPSLLPKYAGCSSLAWAIINNEEYVGYTWHKITENFDEGDILLQAPVKVDDLDTSFSLWNRVNKEGIIRILDVIKMVIKDEYMPIKQDLKKRTYFPRGFPSFDEALEVNKNLSRRRYERASFFPSK